MLLIIPKEFVALLTFPGIIVHEIAHRFMCDLFNIPVYKIDYFSLEKNSVGKVIHQKTYKYKEAFLIAMAPLFINSFIAMILMIPFFIHGQVKDIIPASPDVLINLLFIIISWIGTTIGIHAIPSNQDVENLTELAHTKTAKNCTNILIVIIAFFNIPFIGFWLRIFYVGLIIGLPTILLFY